MNLVYFKKANQQWGIPVGLDTTAIVASVSNEAPYLQLPYFTNNTLQFLSSSQYDLQIYNMEGKLEYSSKNKIGNTSLPLSFLNTGIYIYLLNIDGKQISQKFSVVN